MSYKMKIAVLTRRYGFNFGSSLQAYAMRLLLESLDNEVEILNYDEFSQHWSWKIKPFVHSILIPFLCLCGKIGIRNIYVERARKEYLQIKKFASFDKFQIKPTTKVLHTYKQLNSIVKNFDACVCGSDQIWNPTGYDSHYFLDFCNKRDVKKISYAPSFGVKKILFHKDDICRFLKDFDNISVREEHGCFIVEDLVGHIDCPVVLDPTLMIPADVWREQKKELSVPLPSKYIACYFLGNQYIPYQVISKLASETQYPIVNITTFRTINDIVGIQKQELSPFEFLYVIDKAEYILTDSFHATVFSILFEKNFYSFNKHKNDNGINENSRLYSLLSMFRLQERHIIDHDAFRLCCRIDYNDVNHILNVRREKSIEYLKHALFE